MADLKSETTTTHVLSLNQEEALKLKYILDFIESDTELYSFEERSFAHHLLWDANTGLGRIGVH